MNSIESKTAKLLIHNPKKSVSTVDIFQPETTPLEKQNMGRMVILIEIDSQEKINESVIDAIEEEISVNYYGSENFHVEVAFENALQKANARLHEIISENSGDWLSKLNCLVAVHKDRELHIAQVGDMHAFFIHKTKIFDIVSQPAESFAKTNPLKIFSNVISGTLNENDYILFCTGRLLDYLSQEKIRRIVTENPPEKSVQELDQLLADHSENISFAMVILQTEAVKKMEEAEKIEKITTSDANAFSATAPENSMSSLILKEKATSDLLTPSLLPNFSKGIKNFVGKFQRAPSEKPSGSGVSTLPNQKNKTGAGLPKDSLAISILKYIFALLKKLLDLLVIGIIFLVNLFRDRKNIRRIRSLPRQTNRETARLLIRLKNLSRGRKIILAAACVLIVLFAFSIVTLGKGEEKKQLSKDYANAISQATEKSGEADAALIYENEEDARVLLSEAKGLLSTIPATQKDLAQQISTLSAKIQEQLNKVNHVVRIDNPSVIADISVAADPDTALAGILADGGNLIAYDSKRNALFQINTEEQNAVKLQYTGTVEGSLALGRVLASGKIAFIANNDKFYEYDTVVKSITAIDITFAPTEKNVQSFDVYLGRIYTLDADESQVFRHEKSGGKYKEGASWITGNGLDLSGALSLSVDGSVFISKNNGEIIKLFAGGIADDFKLSRLDPAIANAIQIVANPDDKNIYVLDPVNKRMVALDKNGKLINQYYSEQFNGAISIVVSEKEKFIYLLNGLKIYKIDL